MVGLYEYSNGEIAAMLIGGCLASAFLICMGTCGVLYALKRSSWATKKRRKSNGSGIGSAAGGGGGSVHTGSLIKEQSQSVLRGDHPIAFVLPTVTLSETSEFSDLDGRATPGYSSSTSISIPAGGQYRPPIDWSRKASKKK